MEEKQSQQMLLIEEMGRHFDKEGMQPVASRIFSLLMVSDKEEMTFEEITAALQISKSSASNGLKLLEIRKLVEYITYPGDRKRYFRIKTKELFSMIDEFESKMIRIQRLNTRIINLKTDKSSRVSVFLKDFNRMVHFFQQRIGALKEEYQHVK
jgi:DNA-binding transcriptional regulator GbsR (MarR family)